MKRPFFVSLLLVFALTISQHSLLAQRDVQRRTTAQEVLDDFIDACYDCNCNDASERREANCSERSKLCGSCYDIYFTGGGNGPIVMGGSKNDERVEDSDDNNGEKSKKSAKKTKTDKSFSKVKKKDFVDKKTANKLKKKPTSDKQETNGKRYAVIFAYKATNSFQKIQPRVRVYERRTTKILVDVGRNQRFTVFEYGSKGKLVRKLKNVKTVKVKRRHDYVFLLDVRLEQGTSTTTTVDFYNFPAKKLPVENIKEEIYVQ